MLLLPEIIEEGPVLTPRKKCVGVIHCQHDGKARFGEGERTISLLRSAWKHTFREGYRLLFHRGCRVAIFVDFG